GRLVRAKAASAEHWLSLARHSPLGILCDLDGTLVPFASTPDEARPDANVIALVEELATRPSVTLAIVSGRPKAWLEAFFRSRRVFPVAEHGSARRGMAAWENVGEVDQAPLSGLAAELEPIVRRHPGALVERKQTSVALHYRQVPRGRRGELLIEA